MQSKAELLAQKWFHSFNNNRMVFGFTAMLILTFCSIYFNFRLGQLNANPADKTWYVMPLSYSFLDVAALVFAMVLFAGAIRGVILKAVSWAWFGYLVALSLFACLSCILALDAMSASSGDEFKRQQLNVALVQANDRVDTWQTNFENTERHKSKFNTKLNDAVSHRDEIIDKISKLDSSTPPSQVVFEKMMPLLPVWMDEDMLKTYARLAFGVAMIITPLMLTGVLANVLGSGSSGRREDYASLGKSRVSTTDRSQDYGPYHDGRPDQAMPDQAETVLFEDRRPDQGSQTRADRADAESNVVLFEDRRPDQTKQTATAGPKSRSRRTGLDRDVAAKIEDYLINGTESIATGKVAKKFGVGKDLIGLVYDRVADQGHIYQDGPGKPWKRNNQERAYS